MTTEKQRSASQRNIKKAQEKWQSMTHRQHSKSQPSGNNRAKPGTSGEGNYFRIEVRPREEFSSFRYQDIGRPGHIQRLAGKRSSGSWDTQTWLIAKEDAHTEGNRLIPDTNDAKELIDRLASKLELVKGDVFQTKDSVNGSRSKKSTTKQKRTKN